MSSPEQGGEPLPYYQNQYLEKLAMFGDAANLMLDTYGTPETGFDNQPIETCSWTDPEIATSYSLARFRQAATVDPLVRDQLEFVVTENYPNGEVSERMHSINPTTKQNSSRLLCMTATQRAEEDEMNKKAREVSSGIFIGPPSHSRNINPEHAMEMHIQALTRGFEMLETESDAVN